VDRTGTLKTTDTLDTIGLLGSDLYGLRKSFLAAFQGDPQYPTARNYFDRQKQHAAKTSLRIGVITDQFGGYFGYDTEVKSDFAVAVDLLARSGLRVMPVAGAGFINEIHSLHQEIYCKALSYYFQEEFSRGTQMSEVMTRMIAMGTEISVQAYENALEQQPRYRARFDRVFDDYDFIVTPSTASVAPRIGESEKDDTCLIWTFLGYPVLSVPTFWSEEQGLPFGLQIVAPKFGDLPLLQFGQSILGILTADR